GKTSRDFTYVENAVQANIRSLLARDINRHEVINIALGESTTLNQLWKHIAGTTGTHSAPIYREGRKGDIRHSLADIRKAKKLIGYEPEISVQKGIELTVNWYRSAYT